MEQSKRLMSGVHFMQGNYAAVEGAIAAGCDFFAGYPITPANEVSEGMARRLPAVGGVFFQGEDELCSIYATTSASLAGAKAMTATASAGYDYMMEGLEYAVAVEAPMVVVDVMRCRGENFATQSDIMQVRWGAAGDHEMIVLAPSTVQETFDFTVRAFNLSEEYRTPVVVISEMSLALMRERLEIPVEVEVVNRRRTEKSPEEYRPFEARGEWGVPDFAELGTGYRSIYSINPHDERGDIEWSPSAFERLYRRITGKVRENRKKISTTWRYSLDDADIALVAYGSEVRPALDAVGMARERGIRAGLLKVDVPWPFPEEAVSELSSGVGAVVTVEMNMGKYAGEVERSLGGRCRTYRAVKNLGTPHTPGEILSVLEEVRR